ncbi:MAG: 4a-hydroxytetrahydrobiopterin dehydratase [Betaproteobacteria bacterium]|jgi:4a-hydroxytetrahydrobiopterin dehydratase
MTTKITENLIRQKCQPCEGGVDPIPETQAKLMLNGLQDWSLSQESITKNYEFQNHYQAVAFLNAIAWISHREDHHPDISLGYNSVSVTYTTHAIDGLSENDFICAAKVDHLFNL